MQVIVKVTSLEPTVTVRLLGSVPVPVYLYIYAGNSSFVRFSVGISLIVGATMILPAGSNGQPPVLNL